MTDVYSTSASPDVWWRAHFHEAADSIINFFGGDGISLEDKVVADIGCGDGVIDLGIAVRAKPQALVGYDILPVDPAWLADMAKRAGGIDELPENLRFATSGATTIPADDNTFDFVISWSAFEHILEPVAILREIRRIMKPEGVLFIQLYPFYDSPHGPHLQDWFPDGFAHHQYPAEEIIRLVRESDNQVKATEMIEVFATLNKITVDGLHDALREAAFRPAKLQLMTEQMHIPDYAKDVPFSRIGITGIQLMAVVDPEALAREVAVAHDAGEAPSPLPPAEQPSGGARGRRLAQRLGRLSRQRR